MHVSQNRFPLFVRWGVSLSACLILCSCRGASNDLQPDTVPFAMTATTQSCGCSELIRNGSFEDFPAGSGPNANSFLFTSFNATGNVFPPAGIWVVLPSPSGASVEIVNNTSTNFPEPVVTPNTVNPGAEGGATYYTPCGNNCVFITDSQLIGTSLQQEIVTDLVGGKDYDLSFYQSGRPLLSSESPSLVHVNISTVAQSLIQSTACNLDFKLPPPPNNTWEQRHAVVHVTQSGRYNITFSASEYWTGHTVNGTKVVKPAIIDAVSFKAKP